MSGVKRQTGSGAGAAAVKRNSGSKKRQAPAPEPAPRRPKIESDSESAEDDDVEDVDAAWHFIHNYFHPRKRVEPTPEEKKLLDTIEADSGVASYAALFKLEKLLRDKLRRHGQPTAGASVASEVCRDELLLQHIDSADPKELLRQINEHLKTARPKLSDKQKKAISKYQESQTVVNLKQTYVALFCGADVELPVSADANANAVANANADKAKAKKFPPAQLAPAKRGSGKKKSPAPALAPKAQKPVGNTIASLDLEDYDSEQDSDFDSKAEAEAESESESIASEDSMVNDDVDQSESDRSDRSDVSDRD